MKRNMIGSVVTLILVLCLFSGWLYFQQPAMIFFPYSRLTATPTDWGLQYKDVTLNTSEGIRLHGWYIPNSDSNRVLLYFHGNAGNISHRGESVASFHRLGLNVFIIDYRGYGQSEGRPSEEGLYDDARVAWQYLTKTRGFGKQDIIIFGRSLGGAVATNLAAEVQPGALILDSVFSSAKDMASELYPVILYLTRLWFHFNSVERIQQVTSPLLVFHSPEDEIIPYQLGEKVFQAANEPKTFVTIRGGHNRSFLTNQSKYEQVLKTFLSQHPLP